jgi:hypothetical protein
MKKFNAFEANILEEGVKLYLKSIGDDIKIADEAKIKEEGVKLYIKSICEDIKIAESEGRRPIMTVDYMHIIEKEILTKLKNTDNNTHIKFDNKTIREAVEL